MELKMIETSRVVYLTQPWRPGGQIFLPDAFQALLNRYRFQKFPTKEELYQGDTFLFNQGVFEDIGIIEFGLYPDGLVVSSRANTTVLDLFIQDVLKWAERDLGIVETDIPPKERHYESTLVVSLQIKEEKSFPYLANLNSSLTAYQENYGLRTFAFSFSAIQVANDPTTYGGRKPVPFTIARRVNVPFDADIYFATAPLKTDDHIAVLEALEKDFSSY